MTPHGSDWHEGACCGRGGALGAAALTERGAGPRGARRSGEGGPTRPSHCAVRPRPAPDGSEQERPCPAQRKGARGQARPAWHSPEGAFLWSLSLGAWVGRGGELGWGQQQPLPMPPLLARPHCVQGRWAGRQPVTRELFPRKGAGAEVTWKALGSASPQAPLSTDWLESRSVQACVPVDAGGAAVGASGSLLVLQPPLGGAAGPPSCAVGTELGGRGGGRPNSRRHRPWGRVGGRWGLLLSLCGGDTGAEAPGGRVRWLNSGWVGGSGSQGKRAPPWGLGQAGATGNHNNYKIKPFPLGGKTNNKNPTK